MRNAVDSAFLGGHEAPLAAAERQLRTPPPDVTEAEAIAVAKGFYGIEGKACLLTGERDRNFLITAANGVSHVLKFYNSAEDAPTRALQHGALQHVRALDFACPVPEIRLALDGQEEVMVPRGDVKTAAAMISQLPGVNPEAGDLSANLRHDIGRVIGRLSRALSGYEHPRADRAILWDMMHVAELRPLAALIESPKERASLERWLDMFSAEILPATTDLPYQTIHNDLSLSNIMVDPIRRDRVTGVIDFGDIVRAPRINEFAVAASYFISQNADPVQSIGEILGGIDPGLQLLPEEIGLLPELIKARLATRILLSGWRAQLFPCNQTYILRSTLSAWVVWRQFEAVDQKTLRNGLLPFMAMG